MTDISLRLFAALANDKSPALPYNREVADQRRKYGDIMLRKADEHLASQRQHEAEQLARIEAGRRKREDERKRQEEAEASQIQILCNVGCLYGMV